MTMAIVTAHAGADTLGECVQSWLKGNPFIPVFIENGSGGILPAYQSGFESASHDHNVIAFLHDDTLIRDESWVERVWKEFEDPTVGIVGFGGALEHGTAGLYRDPYDYRQLGRAHFMSNMEDAENHGQRFADSCDVAVLDGFALIVRREILTRSNGWPIGTPVNYSCYDYWLSAITHRQGFKIRLVGIACKHYGGRTAISLKMADGQGQAHIDAHDYIAKNFIDVLPWRCPCPRMAA